MIKKILTILVVPPLITGAVLGVVYLIKGIAGWVVQIAQIWPSGALGDWLLAATLIYLVMLAVTLVVVLAPPKPPPEPKKPSPFGSKETGSYG